MNDFNTDETVKFPSAVALMWRWTGRQRASATSMYDFAKRNLHYVADQLDADRDGWPEGSGNVERAGHGPGEARQRASTTSAALLDLADMARSKHDNATVRWATGLAHRLRAQFESTWWDPTAQQYADSLLDPGNTQSFQKHWIGVRRRWRPSSTTARQTHARAWHRTTTARPRWPGARTTASAATVPATSGSSTPAAEAEPTARATSRSSR